MVRPLSFLAMCVISSGCGGDSTHGAPDATTDGACGAFCNPFGDGSSDSAPTTCTGGIPTTVSGTVHDPAGRLPVYDAIVYVPSAPLAPIQHGATCDRCGATLSGNPVVGTLTDSAGSFSLANVPAGTNVPLVIQVGKWRRHITIPLVTACVDNPIADAAQTRLPTRPQENHSDDDIPTIAVTTGGADALECLLPKIGIDPGQFVNKGTAGRVNIYQGIGGSTLAGGSPDVTTFWNDESNLASYDLVLLGCEGETHPENKGNGSYLPQMELYANAGGRVLATHYQYYWIESNPLPSLWRATATWNHASDPPQTNWPVLVDMAFPKGLAFAKWMLNAGASTALGTFPIAQGRHDVDAINGQPPTDPTAVRWVYATAPVFAEYYTFNTPVAAADKQCGKVAFSDLHVAAGDTTGGTFPQTCNNLPLTPQEKALEFLLFDLSSCIQNDSVPPATPVN